LADVRFLVYRNRFNEVSGLAVEVIAESEEYLDCFDQQNEKFKTLKCVSIISSETSLEKAIENAKVRQSDFEILPRNKTGKTYSNPDGKLQVCFTGFPRAEKQEMVDLAQANQMIVRTDVSSKIDLLVCGPNAGWSKLKKASSLNIARAFGSSGFQKFIDTGEFAE
jgi:NAD-dependent DNA ligase